MRVLRLSAITTVTLCFYATVAHAQTPPPDYQGIPDGFDYPADKARLEKDRADQNLSALRKHSWMLFAGMTQMKPDGTPYWETWFRATEAFRPAGPTPQGPRRLIHEFEVPRQFKQNGVAPQAPGDSAISFVLFNWEGYDHIRTNELFKTSKLDAINASFPAGTAWDKRRIPDFKPRAMTIKTVWWPVDGNGQTPIPIWDNDPAHGPTGSNPHSTWKRVVVADGKRSTVPEGEYTNAKFLNKQFPHSHVVGVGSFYGFKVDQATVDAITANPDRGFFDLFLQQALGRKLRAGDFIVLVAMHATSKEIDDWTWQTFWWHDKPNDGPYAADRPDAVKGIWRNYLMANADDQVTPTESQGKAHIGFNPWLEARFQNGVQSNCMSCHHRASYPNRNANPADFLPVTRGLPDPANDPAFAPGRLQTDFMWSIIDRAQ